MFTIRWMPVAFEQMARIVRDHPARKAEFAVTLKALTQALSDSPTSFGESREGTERIVFWDRLFFDYQILDAEKRVEILSAGFSNRK